MNDTFLSKVVLPGLIDQHLHPFLGALTLATEVIATEDWVLPGRTFKSANSSEAYLARLKAADAAMADKNEWLFSWGYHKLWHGKLDRKTLDAVSTTRPIMIWQRSCHEFYFNTAAIKALGLTAVAMPGKGDASKMFNWEEGHWWETGLNLVIQPILKVFATPERMVFGLKQMVAYLHQNGVTAYMEPGALLTPDIWSSTSRARGARKRPSTATSSWTAAPRWPRVSAWRSRWPTPKSRSPWPPKARFPSSPARSSSSPTAPSSRSSCRCSPARPTHTMASG